MQQAFTFLIFIYFLPLVFIGAFFLLNLTLAVINSKFTDAQHEQQAKDELEMQNKGQISNEGKPVDNEMATALSMREEITISQYLAARRAAKKMKEFLRMRQLENQQELERQCSNPNLTNKERKKLLEKISKDKADKARKA